MIIRLILVLVILVVVYVNGYINNYNRYSNSNIMKSLRYNKIIFANKHKYNQQNAILTTLSASNIMERSRSMSLSFKVVEDEEVEEDDEVIEFDNEDGNRGNVLMSKLSRGVVPLAASLGFALTPSTALTIRIAGAAVGGAAGLLARKTIIDPLLKTSNDDNDFGGSGGGNAVLPASVLKTLAILENGPPTVNLSLKKLEEIAKKNGVASEDLGLLFTYVFSQVVYDAVSKEGEDVTDLIEVVDFAEDIGLTPQEIGDGFSLAAIKVGQQLEKDSRGFFVAEYSHEIFLQAAKIFFLGDKMIGNQSGYYGKRLSVALHFFTPDSLKDQVTDACTNLFRRCVESVVSNPDDFSLEEVENLRQFLTPSASASSLRPANMQSMIMEALHMTLDNDLSGENALDVKIKDYGSLVKAKNILGWNSLEFDATIETRTMPKFETAAREIVKKIVENPELAPELAEVLAERIKSLNIDERKARVLLTTIISEQNAEYMEKIDKVYKVSSNAVEPAFKVMVKYSAVHAGLKTLTEKVMDGIDIPVPGLPFADIVRASMFEMKIKNPTASVNDDMFSLDEDQQRIVRKNLALPKVTSWVSECLAQGNFKEDAKSAYRKILDEYGVTDKDWQATALDFYYQEVQRVATTRAIPTSVDMQRLADIQTFVGCDEKNVQRVHLELLGDKYVKAVTEAMTPTGVITEEYIDGLERLRTRLQLSEEDAKSLFGLASRNRIGPVVKDLCEVWKSDSDATKRREKEMQNIKKKSGDPISSPDNVFGYMETGAQKDGGGPNVFMREALNMVDFFEQNYITQNVNIESLDSLPVTASGVVPYDDMVGMFKHYLITRLSEPDDELRQRYVDKERVFALALGISNEGQAKIKESLGYTACKNMLKQVLRMKDGIDAEEYKQFAMLKDSLGLTQEVADKILDEASRHAIVEHATVLFRPKDNIIDASTAIRFRSQVQSLGFNMQKETGFNERLVTYLYALEVQYLVENGMESDLKEVQEAYDIPEEKATEIIEVCCKRYVDQLLNLALRAAKKYDERETLSWVTEIMKYSPFISDSVNADGNIYSEKDKERMISFYENDIKEGEKRDGSRLRELVCLSEDYIPPLEGIDGLLGKVKGLSDLEAQIRKDQDEGKKTWAWG